MLKLFVTGILAWFCLTSAVASPFSVVRQYVFPLENRDRGRNVSSSGSGVLIAEGMVLTVAHVLPTDDRQFTVVITKDGAKRATEVYVDKELDLALLAVDISCPCAPISKSLKIDVDTEVYAVGYPMYVNYKLQVLTIGHMQGLYQNMLITTTNTAPGGSGGAVFVRERNVYRLVGVITGAAVINIGPPLIAINQIQNWFVVSSRAPTIRDFLIKANDKIKKEAVRPPLNLDNL